MCMMCMMHMMMGHDHGGQHQPATTANVTAAGRGCAHCGYPLQPGFAFCPSCGMSLQTSACPSCGQGVDPSWKACPYCGAQLSASATADAGHAHH